MKIPLPADEAQRLVALCGYAVLDTASEACFDDLAELAAHRCAVPIALISFIDTHRQWFKARVNFEFPEITRDMAFCTHTIQEKALTVVPDTTRDARFLEHPLVVGGPKIRFYAGVPLMTPEGYAIGTLCVIDREPHDIPEDQQSALRVLSRQVMAQLELRRRTLEVEQLLRERGQSLDRPHQELGASGRCKDSAGMADIERRALFSVLENQTLIETSLQESEQRFRATFDQAAMGIAMVALDGHWLSANQKLCDILGYTQKELGGLTFQELTHPDDLDIGLTHAQKMLAGEQSTYSTEKRYLRKDGAVIWASLTVSLVRNESNAPEYFISVIEDISERKRMGQALKESERHFRRVLDSVLAFSGILAGRHPDFRQ